jgi:hypothetical protein
MHLILPLLIVSVFLTIGNFDGWVVDLLTSQYVRLEKVSENLGKRCPTTPGVLKCTLIASRRLHGRVTLLQGCAVQPGLIPRIKVSHENVGVQPAFLTDSLARLFTRYSPCFCTEQTGRPLGLLPGGGDCGLLPSETDLLHYNQLSYLYVFMSPFPSFMSSASGEIYSSSDTHMHGWHNHKD